MRDWDIRKNFPSIGSVASAGAISLACSYLFYSIFFQRHFLSWRYLLLSILLFIAAFFVIGWINSTYISKKFRSLEKQRKIVLVLFSIFFTISILINIPVHPVYYFLPDSEFSIRFRVGDDLAAMENVKLLWIHTGQGFVHNSDLVIRGDWQYIDQALVFEPGQDVEINWTGKAGRDSEVVFQNTTQDQFIEVVWNGDITETNLISPYSEKIILSFNTPLPFLQKLLFSLSFILTISYLLFVFILLINEWKPDSEEKKPVKPYSWILFMLPMVIVWTFSLLVFWPGVFSNDSLHHWQQAVTGQFNDWQSAIYAMVLSLLIKVNYSLSFVLILRIFYFSCLVAYGLGLLARKGVPRILLWVISILFAVSPLNNLQVITLWRDIPYAIAFLCLTYLLIEIYDSDGEWITKKKNIALLIINTLVISLLRLNGIPAILISLLILVFVYRRQWKQFMSALVIMITLLVLIKGPFYDLMRVDRDFSGQSNQILLHHIAAHLDAGTKFEESEIAYLDELLPIEEWDYQCCYVGPIFHRNDFDRDLLLTSSAYNQKLTLSLFLRDPIVDIKHMFCAGEHAWRFGEKQCEIFSTHGFNSWYMGEQDWIIPNDYGLEEASVLPNLIQPYSDLMRKFGFLDEDLVTWLQPAFFIYTSALALFIAYFRNRDWKVLLIGMPLALHTLILFLINSFPVFRYFYCNHLVGLFLIGFIFYKRNKE